MSLHLQYITDQKGNKNAVLLSLNEWEKIQRDLDEYEKLKDKRTFFEGLTNAFHEVKLITEGKKKPNSFDDLLNEL
jgi:PHD/YefM family antitoxin component YafN of YafNO toxin-antitoxin module